VAVGGTDFGDGYFRAYGTYWRAENGRFYESAISYIPEIPWNSSCASTLLTKAYGFAHTFGTDGFCNSSKSNPYQQVLGGGGGSSNCAAGKPNPDLTIGNTCKGRPRPSWQAGVVGLPNNKVRNLPDVSLFSAVDTWRHFYLFCWTDTAKGGKNCRGNPGQWSHGGGTSFAAPIWAGFQALVDQKTGNRQGNPNYRLYKLAASQYGVHGNATCNSNHGNKVNPHCIFRDVTIGDNDMPCIGSTPECYDPSGLVGVMSTTPIAYRPTFLATVGWDFATGIGTVNVADLVNAW
jgi:hypothetical protein